MCCEYLDVDLSNMLRAHWQSQAVATLASCEVAMEPYDPCANTSNNLFTIQA
jgi:hypothetical protein